MVCKDNRSAFIAIQEYLGLHAVKTKPDGNINGIVLFLDDLKNFVFHIRFIRQGRNIRRTAYGNRNTADSTAFRKKAFIDKPCNMTEHIIVGTAGNYITVQNKLPCVFQIQNFLHVGSCHTGYFSVLYDLFRLRKRCCNTLQNSLIIDIHFHIGTRKGNVVYNIGGKGILGITDCGKLLFNAAKRPSDFTGFSGIAQKQIIQFFGICAYISRCQFSCYTFSHIKVLPIAALFDFGRAVIGH